MFRKVVAWFAVLVLAVGPAGCAAQPSDTPPPEAAQLAYDHIREGYTSENVAVLTQDFAEIMFTGQTAESYGKVIAQLKEQLGEWGEGVYYGAKDNEHTWRVSFDKGSAKVLIVLDEEGRVSGLWFR